MSNATLSVVGKTGTYTVTLGDETRCSCPDFLYRGTNMDGSPNGHRCKHLKAALAPIVTVAACSPVAEPKPATADALILEAVAAYRSGGTGALSIVMASLSVSDWNSIGRRLVALGCPRLGKGLDRRSRLTDFCRLASEGEAVSFPEPDLFTAKPLGTADCEMPDPDQLADFPPMRARHTEERTACRWCGKPAPIDDHWQLCDNCRPIVPKPEGDSPCLLSEPDPKRSLPEHRPEPWGLSQGHTSTADAGVRCTGSSRTTSKATLSLCSTRPGLDGSKNPWSTRRMRESAPTKPEGAMPMMPNHALLAMHGLMPVCGGSGEEYPQCLVCGVGDEFCGPLTEGVCEPCCQTSRPSPEDNEPQCESDRLWAINSELLAALEKIERWMGEFPPTGRTWDDGSPMSYGAAYGSNGERDYMRQVAREAIAKATNPEGA